MRESAREEELSPEQARAIAYLENLAKSENFRDGFVRESVRAAEENVATRVKEVAAEKDRRVAEYSRRAKELAGETALALANQEMGANFADPEEAAKALKKDWSGYLARAMADVRLLYNDEEYSLEEISSLIAQEVREEFGPVLQQAEDEVEVVRKNALRDFAAFQQSVDASKDSPDFLRALDVWGVSPDSKDQRGDGGTGFHAGIAHYFQYREDKAKSGRFAEGRPMTIEGFVNFSNELRDLLAEPRPEINERIQESHLFTDNEGGYRLMALTKDGMFISAIQNAGEAMKVVTGNQKYNEKKWEKDLAAELDPEKTKGRLNQLGVKRREANWEEYFSFVREKEVTEMGRTERIFEEAREHISESVRFPLPEEYRKRLLESGRESELKAYEQALRVVEAMQATGGVAMFVGGSVRDYLFGKAPKDYDIEVYGLEPEQIHTVLNQLGKVDEVGAAFGILKLNAGGYEIDVSLPRKDSKIAEGHTGFAVDTDPDMSVKEAARRRDFTMNTVACNPLTGDIYDAFGGVSDIQNRILNVTDRERFADDPLRVLRGVQFVSRFELTPNAETLEILREMALHLPEIPGERIYEEWYKQSTKAVRPSFGLQLAKEVGVFSSLHPSLEPLVNDEKAWAQTLIDSDASVAVFKEERVEEKLKFAFSLTLLLRSFADGTNAGGRFSESRKGHVSQEVEQFLRSMKATNEMRNRILKLIESLEVIPVFAQSDAVHDGALRRLAREVFPGTIKDLVLIAHIMHPQYLEEYEALSKRAEVLDVLEKKPANVLEGRDWLAKGYKPGVSIGRLVALGNDLRDEQDFTKEEILNMIEDGVSAEEAITILNSKL